MATSLVDRDRARLERRPEATAFQVDNLLTNVASGVLRLPAFQRKLKWQPKDMLDLFDSLYRGFPIGTLLLWKRAAPAGPVAFGDYHFEAGPRPDALWIVDGQQRVTTLASSLLRLREPRERALLFDLEDERFLHGPVPAASASASVPVRTVAVQDLFHSTRAITWIAKHMTGLRPQLVERALDCGKRLREYQVPAYVVETDDENVLREVFDRVNRTGRRLDDTDVFTALFVSTSVAGESADLGHVSRRIAQRGFGLLAEKTVLSALRAVRELPLDRDFTKGLDRAETPEALAQTEAALTRATDFLRRIGFVHAALVPYELLFVVLARFFHLHPEPRVRNDHLLRRWVWRGSLAGQLGGASVSLRQHVEAVTADEDASVQALIALDPAPSELPPLDTSAFRLDRAKSALAACGLASLEPRDLETGELLDIGALFDREPRKSLLEITKASGSLASSVANRLLHPLMPARDLLAMVLKASPEVLASHAISPAARAALELSSSEAFLADRASELDTRLGAFFARQCELGADDSPALEALLAGVNDDFDPVDGGEGQP